MASIKYANGLKNLLENSLLFIKKILVKWEIIWSRFQVDEKLWLIKNDNGP